MRHTLPLITLAGAGVMAQSSSTATNSTLTTSFYFPGGANAMMSPVASVIGVNDTFTDIVTYLIKCPSSSLSASDSAPASASASGSASSAPTPAPTTTAPLNRRTVISATSTSTYTDTGIYSASDVKRTFCLLPEAGKTLIVGPSTMNLLYTSSGTTDDISCAITWASGSAASASATAAASASATSTTSAEANCRMYGADPGLNIQAIRDSHYPDAGEASMWPKLLVTAGLEKLQAASASATASMDSPTITGSGDEASSTGAAAALRFDFPTAMGMTGAAGILAVALAL